MMGDLVRMRVLGLAAIAAVVIIDQATKLWFYEFLLASGRRYVEVLPFFNLVTVWNYGVSFGMFNSSSSAGSWIFVILALAIVAVLAYWLWHTPRRLPAVALSMVIGGALGNVVDRLRYGAVFDFLDFHAFGWHWPAFNAADAAITLGVVALFVDSLFGGAQESKKGA
jgi:lipoprotein signal peptidase